MITLAAVHQQTLEELAWSYSGLGIEGGSIHSRRIIYDELLHRAGQEETTRLILNARAARKVLEG